MTPYGRPCFCWSLPGRLSRRPVASLLLAVYLLLVFGLPFPPAERTASTAGASFPCEGGHCGCRDADTCWRSCCCHTPAQRLAWARRHGVTPPGYLQQLVAASLDGNASDEHAGESAESSCCSRPQPLSSHRVSSSATGCCGAVPEGPVSPVSPSDAVVVMGDAALKCRGLTALFGVSSPVLPLVWHTFDHALCAREWIVRPPSAVGPRRSDLPVVPPPERPIG